MYQDVHFMIFFGIGFLLTFLQRYGYSAVSFNLLLASVAVQWSIIVQGLIRSSGSHIHLGITNLIEADVAAASVLISWGALLGKTGPLQLLVVTALEIMVYSLNVHIGVDLLGAVDAGASMFIHIFAAYFGLACSWILRKEWHGQHAKNGPVYRSDLFSLVGTIFLWMCWPSFNGALVPQDQQYRAVINTYLALVACVLAVFATSQLVSNRAKLGIAHIQNATLAGGVALGTVADFMIMPHGAMIIGVFSGIIAVLGYEFVSPFLATKLGIHDTCGIHNLHGLPGLLSAIAGIIGAGIATKETYGENLGSVFPARSSSSSSFNSSSSIEMWQPRSAGVQAGMQTAALLVTLVLAVAGGLVTGLVLKWSFWGEVTEEDALEDSYFWKTPLLHGENDGEAEPGKDHFYRIVPQKISVTQDQEVPH